MTEARPPAELSRSAFLRGRFGSRDHPARGGRPAEDDGEAVPPAALMADFPPTLLNEEALRLGLDPASTDRDTLLRAIHREMLRQRNDVAGTDGSSAPEPPAGQASPNARQ